ncbi:hypothetical protein K469DRAFT_718151 [Zopfia rhizophila CBS 207.26]|uniref:Prion-inhibition and propagation HeLo domain-containing protein n=1 Tax=Zopfia rhizophila CBS 207.26 TaxID=1314779 RepID=A0A6A6DL05_9PEZI|nr:hypothetical protein K469DRAFT_718151 [Zopfia rhizophila CBS 207.26]
MATTENGLATPATTPPASPTLTRAQVLANIFSLATLFSTCVEAFNLIHPSKDSERAQKVALTRLGLQQGRLLIFGDAVGISSPPKTIARHMIPSHPGATNPDPHLPVNFGIRDARLDEPAINDKVRAALNEIAGRPSNLSREELMEKYGLKPPKRFSALGYPALDTNRLEAFREKYGLLQDLVRQSGAKVSVQSRMSMTMQHWTVRDVGKFDAFVKTIRLEVDGLIALMGVKEQVDRGMKTDIRAMGWHPDLSGPIVRQDWEKLKLIREACVDDYPEYVDVTDTALKYIGEELRGTSLAGLRAAYEPAKPTWRKSEDERKEKADGTKSVEKEKRPGFLLHFRFKSWGKSQKGSRDRSKSIAGVSTDDQDPQRSLSEDIPKSDSNALEPVRSKSLSALPDEPAPFNLDSSLENIPSNDSTANGARLSPVDTNRLVHADTANSLIERHDMFQGVGRVETRDIRNKAHDWAT